MLCPLRTIKEHRPEFEGSSDIRVTTRFEECLGETCAWWSGGVRDGKCAMLGLGCLWDLVGYVEDLRGK